MNRRIVCDNCQLSAVRERDGKVNRTLGSGAVRTRQLWQFFRADAPQALRARLHQAGVRGF